MDDLKDKSLKYKNGGISFYKGNKSHSRCFRFQAMQADARFPYRNNTNTKNSHSKLQTIVYICVSCKEKKVILIIPAENVKLLEDFWPSVLQIQKGKQYWNGVALCINGLETKSLDTIT